MTAKVLSADETALVRALKQCGQVVLEQKIDCDGNLPFLVIFQIGKRFYQVNHANPHNYLEALLYLAHAAKAGIILSLRKQIETMRAELDESEEKLTADDDFEKDTDQNARAFEIMKKLRGAEIHTGKRVSGRDTAKCQFMTMYALGDHIGSVHHTTISSKPTAALFIKNMGIHAIGVMLKEYDDLLRRISTPERDLAALLGSGELVGYGMVIGQLQRDQLVDRRVGADTNPDTTAVDADDDDDDDQRPAKRKALAVLPPKKKKKIASKPK